MWILRVSHIFGWDGLPTFLTSGLPTFFLTSGLPTFSYEWPSHIYFLRVAFPHFSYEWPSHIFSYEWPSHIFLTRGLPTFCSYERPSHIYYVEVLFLRADVRAHQLQSMRVRTHEGPRANRTGPASEMHTECTSEKGRSFSRKR